MINNSRYIFTNSSYPKECYKSSFYDYYHDGDRINLFEQKIVCTESFSEDRLVAYAIYFYVESKKIIVRLKFNGKTKVYSSKDKKNKKEYCLNDCGLTDKKDPMKILSFFKRFEEDYVLCQKSISNNNLSIFKEYERMINCSGYEIFGSVGYTYFVDYKTLYDIIKSVAGELYNA
jgi:ubiquitin